MWLELGIYQKNVAIFMENCKINHQSWAPHPFLHKARWIPWKIMDGMSALSTKPCETKNGFQWIICSPIVYHSQLYTDGNQKKTRHIDINEPSLQHVEIDNEDKRELYQQPQSYPPTKIFNVSVGNNPRVVISSCIKLYN